MRVTVIGTGLIGTSIALALREHGAGVWLADENLEAARLAVDLGAGEPLPEAAYADVAVIAVPGALPRVVRLMAHVETDRPRSAIQHVYLRGAAALRLDIAQ